MKSKDLVLDLKKRFKSQDEFLYEFNAYLKGKSSKHSKFFKDNEKILLEMQDRAYNRKLSLFSSLSSIKSLVPDKLKSEFNKVVKYFSGLPDRTVTKFQFEIAGEKIYDSCPAGEDPIKFIACKYGVSPDKVRVIKPHLDINKDKENQDSIK